MFPERELVIDILLVRIHFIIVMMWWTGLAPWEFACPHYLILFSHATLSRSKR